MTSRMYPAILSLLLPLITVAQEMTFHLSDGTSQTFPLNQIDSIVVEQPQPYAMPHTLKESLTLSLSTDSACYHPGSTVTFKSATAIGGNTYVRYIQGDRILEEVKLSSRTWTWVCPDQDYQGYLVQVYRHTDAYDTVLGTIAVDVSSDWKRFPRYGFVATFGSDKTASVVATEMDWLNRCHINGVQFQDWHYKHHWPWGGTSDGQELGAYKDIANRTIYTASVRRYIEAQHQRGMKSMFYNLCYGVLEDAQDDGVQATWYIYSDKTHLKRDYHDLPDSWKSDIYLVNPGNANWQRYIGNRNQEVYSHLDFDGYQIDQLGNRGTRYTNTGGEIDMLAGYTSFIRKMKVYNADKRLVMNAVSNYGAKEIAASRKVDFLYNELWDGEGKFSDLMTTIQQNNTYGGDSLRTVFAAYMDYKLSNTDFNVPGVLLTDAVMFALGGAHLELGGDHMLSREYFPSNSVTMSEELKTCITHYYDFMTAYENLLRDGGKLSTEGQYVPTETSGKCTINGWEPQLGQVTSVARVMDDKLVLHLLNFTKANSLSWRDVDGTMPAPSTLKNLSLQLNDVQQAVQHVYVATPDAFGGSMIEVDFQQQDGKLTFTLPSLQYWTMVVIE